ncbi:hypothetical protein E2C01_037547 [Portunus trituberculatus]|uniref:Uncharacterized protein n=1 Tax=Portunus trituberculatus TaxID=210409 RepID=A0A5B7FBQ2_PORTR|nr:hypothetical protein [Portunus trituberculatus]
MRAVCLPYFEGRPPDSVVRRRRRRTAGWRGRPPAAAAFVAAAAAPSMSLFFRFAEAMLSEISFPPIPFKDPLLSFISL